MKKNDDCREWIVCDFDGTVTQQDACDELMQEFSTIDWRKVGQEYDERRLTHEQLTRLFISSLKASTSEIRELLKERINIREGFIEFIEASRRLGLHPIILSSGWDFSIREILGAKLNLRFPNNLEEINTDSIHDSIAVICNHIATDNDHDWRITSEWPSTSQLSYPDKKAIANFLRANGAKSIMLIGDGSSDYEITETADYVYATESLLVVCKTREIPHIPFHTFHEVRKSIEEMRSKAIKVLSLPSYHPYNQRFDNGMDIGFVNPDSDFFSNPESATAAHIDKIYPVDSYDVVHFHFEHYLIAAAQLEELIQYFKQNNKPIIWTCHDRKSLISKTDNHTHESLLYRYSDAITTLTPGCKRWLEVTFGKEKEIHVIPHGYIAHPGIVEHERTTMKIEKDPNLITIHIGDFRRSKDVMPAIHEILNDPELENARLQLIYRETEKMPQDGHEQYQELLRMLPHPRIQTISMKNIPDQVMITAFLRSHAILLPYRWGTHSGQLELARDCGCHVAVSDVGFYEEQWDEIKTWPVDDNGKWASGNIARVIKEILKSPSLEPAGAWRLEEFRKILKNHEEMYSALIDE